MKEKTLILRFAMVLVGVHAGCSSVSQFENQPHPGDAEVRCENPRVGGLTPKDVFVTIEEIDGAPVGSTKSNGGTYYVRPGQHRLTLFVSTTNTLEARQDFDLEATADRKYLLLATRKGPDFVVEMADSNT